MKRLDIIIPQYNETQLLVERLLNSINNQINVDLSTIGVIIVNDCSNNSLPSTIKDKYPLLDITLLKTPKNGGPGLARQFGIDNSSAEYITFIDADDTYYSNDCLSKVMDVILKDKPNVILTDFMEETKLNNKYTNILHQSDIIYIHGKFINRMYLIENKIRFSQNLRLHEDSYFSSLLLFNTPNPYKLDTITNFWRINPNSLIRQKRKYHYLITSFNDLITSNKELYKELVLRNNSIKNEYIIKAITYLYCILASTIFTDKKDKNLMKIKDNYEYMFYEFLSEMIDVFNNEPNVQLYMNEQINIFEKSTTKVIEPWFNFITRISEKFEK